MAKAKKAAQTAVSAMPAAPALPTAEALMASMPQAAPTFVMPPTIAPSVFAGVWTSNDCLIAMSRPNPFLQAVMPDGRTGTMAEPIGVLQLSPQSAKDLLMLLQDGVAKYEEEWGTINTEYQRSKKV